MILEAIFNGEIYPAETVVPKSEKFREAGQAIADTMRYFEQTLSNEMTERKTVEAKIYKAIDSLEALIQHNASDLSTWIPKEYKLNLTYADDRVSFSEYLTTLRQAIREDTLAKIEK